MALLRLLRHQTAKGLQHGLGVLGRHGVAQMKGGGLAIQTRRSMQTALCARPTSASKRNKANAAGAAHTCMPT